MSKTQILKSKLLNFTKRLFAEDSREVMTEDGLTLTVTPNSVLIKDAEGNVKDAENGDYTLSNGDVITVVDGRITESTVKTDVSTEKKVEEMEEEKPEDKTEGVTENQNGDLLKTIEELKKSIKELTEMLSENLENVEELEENFSKIKSQPVHEPFNKVTPKPLTEWQKRKLANGW